MQEQNIDDVPVLIGVYEYRTVSLYYFRVNESVTEEDISNLVDNPNRRSRYRNIVRILAYI